jgi:hypothetical protein
MLDAVGTITPEQFLQPMKGLETFAGRRLKGNALAEHEKNAGGKDDCVIRGVQDVR